MSPHTDRARVVWSVRDETGMVHRVALVRYYWADRNVRALHVASACRPVGTRLSNDKREDWGGTRLPLVRLQTFIVTEWNVHEVPTCLGCLVVPEDAFAQGES